MQFRSLQSIDMILMQLPEYLFQGEIMDAGMVSYKICRNDYS